MHISVNEIRFLLLEWAGFPRLGKIFGKFVRWADFADQISRIFSPEYSKYSGKIKSFPSIHQPIRSFHQRRTRNGCGNERNQGVRIPFKMISQKQNEANIFSCAYHWVIHFEYNLFTDIFWNENLIKARASTIKVGIDHQFRCRSQLPTVSQKSEQANRTKNNVSW